MKKEQFQIGMVFYTVTGQWCCTDIGTRVITAIPLNQQDPRNYNGPPYSILELVFDEYDMGGCSLDPDEFEKPMEKIIPSKKLDSIHDALMFVSSMGYGECSAILDRKTGKTYYQSDWLDVDEIDQLSEADYDSKIHIHLPDKKDLGLGRDLVFEFVELFIPDKEDKIEHIFSRKGAYSRYKNYLDDIDMLEQWHEFENQRELMALTEWCEDNEVNITD